MSNKGTKLTRTLFIYLILAVSGGAMDAYSYLFRDQVFANAQTGNILLLGVNLAQGNFHDASKYFWPVLCFTLGIITADIVNHRSSSARIHWKQWALAIEAIILLGVCFISLDHNIVANSITSLACGIQVESFRNVLGNSVATTMCIGNLRSGTNNLDMFFQTREKKYLKNAAVYFGIIIVFVIGAIIESVLIRVAGKMAMLFSVVLLVVALVLMPNNDEINK